MIRMKLYVKLPHPNYSPCDYWYTLKLKHGGMMLNDCGELEYVEGSVSAFDFVDTRKWDFRFLEGLCEQIGYLGSKKFYAKDDDGKLKHVVCEFDTWNLIIGTAKTREFCMYLEGERTLVRGADGEDVIGEVVYLDDAEGATSAERSVKVTGDAGALETQPQDQAVPVEVVQEQPVPVKLVEDQAVPVNVIEQQEMVTQIENTNDEEALNVGLQSDIFRPLSPIQEESELETQPEGEVGTEGNEAGSIDRSLQEQVEVNEPEFDDGGIDDALVEELALEIDNMLGDQGQQQPELEAIEDLDSEDEDFIQEVDSCEELIDDIIYEENINKDVEWIGPEDEGNDENSLSSDCEEDRIQADAASDFDSVGSDEVREDTDRPSSSEEPTFSLGQMFSIKQAFKDVVNTYSVRVRRPKKFEKNDARRVYARCKKKEDG